MDTLRYISLLHFASPSPSSPTPGIPQSPNSPKSWRSRERIPLSNGSGEVHNVVDLPDTLEVVEFSSNDKLVED